MASIEAGIVYKYIMVIGSAEGHKKSRFSSLISPEVTRAIF